MAYKFQLGAFTASGSIKAEEGFDANNADINNVDTGSFSFVSSSGDIVGSGLMLGSTSGFITGVLQDDGNGQVELQLAVSGGLEEALNELQIKVATVAGLETDENGLKLRLGFASGLEISGSGPGELNLKLSGSSLTKDGDGLKINTGGVSNDMLAGSIENAKLSNSTISGIALGTNLNSLSASPAGAITLTSYNGSAAVSDLSVNVDDSSIEKFSNNLRIKAGGVTNAMLSGSIDNAKLANQSVTVTAGDGLGGGGAVNLGSAVSLSVNVDDSSIETNADSLRVKASGITNAMLAGSITANKMNNAIFEDLEALGAAASDGEFIVATGAGAFAYESGNTARTSLGLGTADSPTFAGLTVNGDLFVSGSTTTIETTELVIQDALIRVASGSLNLAAAVTATAGFEIGNDLASFKLNGDIDGAGLDGFASSLPISASAFVGDGSNLSGITADSVTLTPVSKADTNTLEANKVNYFGNNSNQTWNVNLPASPDAGDYIYIKAADITGNGQIIINRAGSQLIDGVTSITLESPYAAVTLIYVASNDWRVF